MQRQSYKCERWKIINCKLHNLLITNTIFKHKPSHQTTWISPLPPTFPPKNPYQNQTDYILLRKNVTVKYLTQDPSIATSQGLIINQL